MVGNGKSFGFELNLCVGNKENLSARLGRVRQVPALSLKEELYRYACEHC